jgi:hypothetical protein
MSTLIRNPSESVPRDIATVPCPEVITPILQRAAARIPNSSSGWQLLLPAEHWSTVQKMVGLRRPWVRNRSFPVRNEVGRG